MWWASGTIRSPAAPRSCSSATGSFRTSSPFWARRIQQFFSQPFSVAEQFTGLEGRYVKLEDTLRSFETILGGELDKYPEAAFSNVGNVDEVIAKAKKMGAV